MEECFLIDPHFSFQHFSIGVALNDDGDVRPVRVLQVESGAPQLVFGLPHGLGPQLLETLARHSDRKSPETGLAGRGLR